MDYKKTMAKCGGMVLPQLKDKIRITNPEPGRSRKEIVEERLRKRRNELRALCPPICKSRSIKDIERKAKSPIGGPLVQWQLYKSTHDLHDVSLGLQEAMVDEWLQRNHLRASRLSRLDPIILTNRGSDFTRFMNFVFPPPYCLRFMSKQKRLKSSYIDEMEDLKELCPRLLRTQQKNMDFFDFNPVIRVGGGYRRLSWQTAEVLPAIVQTRKDVASESTCVSCGVNIAVQKKTSDNQNIKTFVVRYPNICANCSKPVNRRLVSVQAAPGEALPPMDSTEERLKEQCEKRQKYTTGVPDDVWTPRIPGSDSDTEFSLTPDNARGSVYITEADGRIKRLISDHHIGHYYGDAAEVSFLNDEGHSSPSKQNIIEHSDPQSGIKVRVRQRSGQTHKDNASTYKERNGNSGHELYENIKETTRKEVSRIESLSSNSRELEDDPEFGKRAIRSCRRWKPKPKYSIYFQERNTKSDSELVIPTERHLFLARKQRKSTGKESNVLIKSNKSLTSEELQRLNTSSKQKRTQANNRENSPEEWGQVDSISAFKMETFSPTETCENEEFLVAYSSDFYTADSEQESTLLKLQAEIQDLKKSNRKKSSGKDKFIQQRAQSNSQNNSAKFTKKDKTIAHMSPQKSKKSLAPYGLDDDSWDSDESLHFGLNTSDEEQYYHCRRPRSLSLDLSDLPSYTKSQGFYNFSQSQRALTLDKRGFYPGLSERKDYQIPGKIANDEANDASEEHFRTDLLGNKIVEKTTKYHYTAKKYRRNNSYKPVPIPDPSSKPKLKCKMDEDDLNESDISFLIAKMQQSYSRVIKDASPTSTHERNCNGQSCFCCGSFVNGCEGTCTLCGTHCKRPGAPCKVCLEICQKCGKPEMRCESGEKAREHDEIHNEVGENDQEPRKGKEIQEECAFEQSAIENSLHSTLESITTSKSRTERKTVNKKTKAGVSRGRRGCKQRTATLNSTETIVEVTPLESENEDNSDDENNEDIQQLLKDVDNNFQVAKPQKSKYTKSKRKFRSSKQVVSQTVVYKNQRGELISRNPSLEKPIDGIDGCEDGNDKIIQDESKPGGEHEKRQGTQEETLPEAQKEESSNQEHVLEKEFIKSEKQSERKNGHNIEEEKPLPQIPKPKLRGVQRVNAAYKNRVELNRRLQRMLKEAMASVMAEADAKVRRDSAIDYMAQYRLVDRSKIEVYGRAFTLEDEQEKGIISYEQMLLALEGVPTIQGMSRQQMNYVLQVLEINTFSRITFKMFAVITALCEKVTSLDPLVKEIVEDLDLTQTEWKLDFYKNMFYVAGDRSVSFITPSNLCIELKAGGLNQRQEDHVIKHITQSSKSEQISFLDYMAYLPLFMSIHQSICNNALDMSRDKYTPRNVNLKT